MNAPRYADCRCAHPKTEHDGALAPQCTHRACTCLHYRPAPALAGNGSPVTQAQLRRAEQVSPTAGRVVAGPPRPTPQQPPAREPEIAVRGERGPTLEQILQAGKRSEFKRTVALAEKIALLVHDLRGRLDDERQAAEAKREQEKARLEAQAEVDRLAAELAKAKEKLKARRHELGLGGGERTVAGGSIACPDCPETFTTNQRLGVHRRWQHGYRRQAAS